jgi:hypothetical protein
MRPLGSLDEELLRDAVFYGKGEFAHFENEDYPNCFACNSHMMLVRPIAVTDDFILLEATARMADGCFVIMPGCWLVYPREHVTTLEKMPDNWTASIKHAISLLDLGQPYCTSDNWGRDAGQTVSHGHTWIIARGDAEEGLLTHQLGLATIVFRTKQLGITAG